MSKKMFKAESKQLLELMIHSIYSNKEVFLRELLSNACDAINKKYFYDLKNGGADFKYEIQIKLNKEERTIEISDTGIGMSKAELEKNLGTIAHSGTKEFLNTIESSDEKVDVIGQFGVGFYSSFIVSDMVSVLSKDQNECHMWKSAGIDSYDIKESTKDEQGTLIKLHLREGEEFDKFLEYHTIKSLVKKYSNYIQYPIYLEEVVETTYDEEGNKLDEPIIEVQNNIVNSMKAIWKKSKKEVTLEEKNDFFKNKYFLYEDPVLIIDGHLEGNIEFDLMLCIPKSKPFDYYTATYNKGLDLYSKEILIEEHVDYLIPDYFNFVKGVVDCADINLNISREMLQKDQVVTKLTKGIENKIVSELKKIMKKDFDTYLNIWENYSREITFGIYNDFGAKKDQLKDLLLFKSSISNEYISLNDYVNKNSEQAVIYYVAGKQIDLINKLPAMEPFIDKGIEVLYFLNDVDEFAISMLNNYEGKEFKSVTSAELDLSENKEEIEKQSTSHQDLINLIKETLKDEVSDVKLTDVLKNSAVRLVSRDGLSIEMEKTLMQMPGNENISANKVLELNINHPVYKKLIDIEDEELLKKYSKVLYEQARIVEGLEITDPIEYVKLVNELFI